MKWLFDVSREKAFMSRCQKYVPTPHCETIPVFLLALQPIPYRPQGLIRMAKVDQEGWEGSGEGMNGRILQKFRRRNPPQLPGEVCITTGVSDLMGF